MTTQQLLNTRYIVIDDYPNSPYKIGDIMNKYTWEETVDSFYTTDMECPLRGKIGTVEIIECYPSIFRKMGWWESRAAEDMPKYLKVIETGEIEKPTRYFIDTKIPTYYTEVVEKKGRWKGEKTPFNLKATIPATEEEIYDYQKFFQK